MGKIDQDEAHPTEIDDHGSAEGAFTVDENYISTSFWYLARKELHITTSFHALRHSAVTLNWKGLEGKEKQAMLGHKDHATTRTG